MVDLLHQFIEHSAESTPQAMALLHKKEALNYAQLNRMVGEFAAGLHRLNIAAGDRIAVYLPKQMEAVISLFGSSAADCVFVPINPILKPAQVGYILRNCNVKVLVTSVDRATVLADELKACPDFQHGLLVGKKIEKAKVLSIKYTAWEDFMGEANCPATTRGKDDIAAILYTSGSTGQPKGVVLSHQNMIIGAHSVAQYLNNSANDRLLAVLPFSFDYGLSQLTTAFSVGASVVLMEYLLPRDVIRAIARYHATGLAAVPPLWNQLAKLEWSDEAKVCLRYITNSGGAMPLDTTSALQASLPNTHVFLMYGLTEAFRSTYLDPSQINTHAGSMGKAIPYANVMVVRPDGSLCDAEEAGELVHTGPLVAQGYWNDPERTAERFKPAPGSATELAVWSGDQVRFDKDGYLYFISRKDEMIKTSGYRVSPTEVETVAHLAGDIAQTVALGLPHPDIGQAILLLVQPSSHDFNLDNLRAHCKKQLPIYMQPSDIKVVSDLPRNANGKIDRNALTQQFKEQFTS